MFMVVTVVVDMRRGEGDGGERDGGGGRSHDPISFSGIGVSLGFVAERGDVKGC